MVTIGMALMYSGIAKNPQRELTEEEVNKIKELVEQLNISHYSSKFGGLGFTGYGVNCEDEGWYVIADFTGMIMFCDHVKDIMEYYKDTVGLCAYLHLILGPTVQRQLEEAQKQMDEYNEKMFGVFPKEEV